MDDIIRQIDTAKSESLQAVELVQTLQALDEVRVQYAGKKGILTGLRRMLGDLSHEQRPAVGKAIGDAITAFEQSLALRHELLGAQALNAKLQADRVDIFLPGRGGSEAIRHPIRRQLDRILDIFQSCGFEVATGPEIEEQDYNFTHLNIPEHHPARDMHDTFYLPDGRVLRTHTSPVQIRVMESRQPPLAIVAPGRVFRCDSDVTLSPLFHQVEGFLIDEGISFADLKGTLSAFLAAFFERENLPVRFRPSFFPFTEPSAEVDIGCVLCDGKGCRVCKNTGWIEILGCGMVHPNVFRSCGLDPDRHQGFAFGIGVERLTMLAEGADDLRRCFDGDVRYLSNWR